MHTLMLLRHDEGIWNFENLFTSWTDVALSEKGPQEAHDAGQIASGMDSADVALTACWWSVYPSYGQNLL
jgi:2,3-bisphosphoglycerate-dependent phosphoglycerate mutase